MLYGLGRSIRKTAGFAGPHLFGALGSASIPGVLLGDGRNYFEKVGDGLRAAPDFINNYARTLRNLENVAKIDDGLDKVSAGANVGTDYLGKAKESINTFPPRIAEALDYFNKAVDSAKVAGQGMMELYDVVKQLDTNAIWNAMVNLSNNVSDMPVETAAAALTTYLAFNGLGKASRFAGTLGQGTWYDGVQRRIGHKLFGRYLKKNPDEMVGTQPEIRDVNIRYRNSP